MQFATRAVHKGQEAEGEFGAVIPPIYMTSTYVQDEPGVHRGYDYTRAGNPNYTNLEQQLAALEDVEYATVFSSGLGAMTALLSNLSAGDHVVALQGIYGGTYRLFTQFFSRWGIHFHFLKPCDCEGLRTLLHECRPKMVFFETPSNPLLELADIQAISELAREVGALSVVDNTFSTPYFQQPLKLGADVALHSATKYLGGHSDVIGGALMTRHKELKEHMDFSRMSMGLQPSPFDAWLTARGVKTLAVRMEQHQRNACQVAEFLLGHSLVKKVYYPGLPKHPRHELAQRQMSGFGGMVTAELDLPMESMKSLLGSFKYFQLAESLGGVESLVCHPATMTHASIPENKRTEIGISDGLVRFSVGIEAGEDLVEDLKEALDRVASVV